MINHKINVAIAEACPDKFRNESGLWFFQYDKDCWMQCHNNSICADLNAMHEAEMTMNEQHYGRFSDLLYDAERERQKHTKKWRWLSSTARQRAEAFLRVLGKWEEVAK